MNRIHLESPEKMELAALLQASIPSQLKVLSIGIERTRKRIKEFEARFQMTGDEVCRASPGGDMGGQEEVMEWAGEMETLRRLQRDHHLPKETEICS